jgi:hypothetical protein
MQDPAHGFPRRPLLETVWKLPEGIIVAYAPPYEEQETAHRPVRRPMGLRRPAPSRTQRAWTSQDPRLADDPGRHLLLRSKERLPLAITSPRLPALEKRSTTGSESGVSTPPSSVSTPSCESERGLVRIETLAQRGYRRLPVGQDHYWGGRGPARIRRR